MRAPICRRSSLVLGTDRAIASSVPFGQRTPGANSSRVGIRELNLLGTGIGVSYSRINSVDRSSNEFQINNERAFGGWTSLNYTRANNSDGARESASVTHPFYALDTPWAAGLTVS